MLVKNVGSKSYKHHRHLIKLFLAALWSVIIFSPLILSFTALKITTDKYAPLKHGNDQPKSVGTGLFIKYVESEFPIVGESYLLPELSNINLLVPHDELEKLEPATRNISYVNSSSKKLFLFLAPSVQGKLYNPSAFFLGAPPYNTTQAWIPMYEVSSNLQYELDSLQFNGREEVWMTSIQAWSRRKGDCEDHAILLADWLIDLGFDARVILGSYKSEGHAWVIVFKDQKEYILEATDKHKLKSWSAYPLAASMPDYHPEIMFNNEELWVNEGSKFTVDYSNKKWSKRVRFIKSKHI